MLSATALAALIAVGAAAPPIVVWLGHRAGQNNFQSNGAGQTVWLAAGESGCGFFATMCEQGATAVCATGLAMALWAATAAVVACATAAVAAAVCPCLLLRVFPLHCTSNFKRAKDREGARGRCALRLAGRSW